MSTSGSCSSILVIGGGGFVGCTLSNELCRQPQGYRVSAIDLPERRPAALSAAVEYRRADMMHPTELAAAMKAFEPNLVICIASWGECLLQFNTILNFSFDWQ